MDRAMIVRIADDIVSPIAMGTHANYECVKRGESMLRRYTGRWGLPEPFMASMMDGGILADTCGEMGISAALYTKFERMAILAAARALKDTDINPRDSRVLFIIATTKGNVEILDEKYGGFHSPERMLLTCTARQVTGWFHNPNEPLVVCNACISGLSAQIEAIRALSSGRYDYAVVVGADVLSPFVVSGFQSLKAVSSNECRPFDEERVGLNLGEAAACVVYGTEDCIQQDGFYWYAVDGVIRNDAFHLSGVSKEAEGACCALKTLCDRQDISDLGFINVHGTATMFNDEMEAVAIHRAGLGSLPVYGLKGYYGHTMGASGVLETLISMEAADDRTLLGTKGFENIGVSCHIDISDSCRELRGTSFLKMMSGFGGGNAVMLFRKGKKESAVSCINSGIQGHITHTVRLTEREVVVDGKLIRTEGEGIEMLKSLYRSHVGNYPKFYKMDPLCKLGFIASELLLNAEAEAEGITRFSVCEDRAVVMVGRTASLYADKTYQQSIQDSDNFYPSPSAFIYTLPNIVTGEIAIRNHYHGETSYMAQDTPKQVTQLMCRTLCSTGTNSVVGGWINMDGTDCFETTLYIIKR